MSKEFKKISQKKLSIKDKNSGYIKKLLLKRIRLPNGLVDTFFIDNAPDSVQIFPVTPELEVIVVLQWRPGFEEEQFEFPGGGIKKENKESHEEAAERELREETGYTGELGYLGAIPYSPYSNGQRHIYLATNCVKVDRGKLDLDKNEFLEVKLISLDEFKAKLLKTNKIRGIDLAYKALDILGKI